MAERQDYLADAAGQEMQRRVDGGELAKDGPHLRDYFEAGYAFLRAARLHGYELPVENPFEISIAFQSSLDVVAFNLPRLPKNPPTPLKLDLIFSTAQDILAINHIEEKRASDVEEMFREFDQARKRDRQESEATEAISAVNEMFGFRNS